MLPKLKYLIGSGFTSGRLLPMAPGSEGSMVALLLGGLFWFYIGPIAISALFLISSVAGFWSAPWYIETHGEDPESFVMDEWAGQFLALQITWIFPQDIELPILIVLFVSAFILFRFFDILKPLGIKRLERLPGSFGVMTDDLLAGLYTFLTLFFVILAIL